MAVMMILCGERGLRGKLKTKKVNIVLLVFVFLVHIFFNSFILMDLFHHCVGAFGESFCRGISSRIKKMRQEVSHLRESV